MYGLQKFKEFINDLGSTINEFASIPSQHDPHHTRDAQLRRRSSWSDLSSFFKFNRGGARAPEDGGSETHSPVGGCTAKTPTTNTVSNASGSKASTTGSLHGGKTQPKNSRTQGLSRSPSLRINSNGNVVAGGGSSKHRRVSNNSHLLQYENTNTKGSSSRYQQGKSNMNKGQYPNSAPATPKGSHAGQGGLLPPIRPDHRGQNPSSPVNRRSPNSQQNAHRRPSPHSVPSSFAVSDQTIRDHNYNKQYSNDPSHRDNRLDYQSQSHDPRSRSSSDPRKHVTQHGQHQHAGVPHAGQHHPGQQHAGQSHQGRQELSKENLENFNSYGNAHAPSSYEPPSSGMGLHRSHSARIPRNVQQQDTSAMVPIHMDNRYVVPPQAQDPHHMYDNRSPHGHDNRHPTYPPPNIESNFRPVESYSRGDVQAAHHSGDRYEHDFRGGNPEFNSGHVIPVPKHGASYRTSHELSPGNDSKLLGRGELHQTNKSIPVVSTQKVDTRHGAGSAQYLRSNQQLQQPNQQLQQPNQQLQQPPHNAGTGGRYSPNHTADNELINGSPSRQYYDSMISQISNQIARVSEGGAGSQQPFTTVLQKAAPTTVEDDDNEWC